MAWQLLAIWVIVGASLVWFVRDERRLGAEAALERAARYYAHAPQYRHITPEPGPLPVPALRRLRGLSQEQRDLLAGLRAPKAPLPD